jgi:hypothetical protein
LAVGQGFIEHIKPPVAQRGKTTRVSFIGTRLAGAGDVWSSLPAGKLKATPVATTEPTRATMDVTVANDAPVGLCGVRVATPDGLSNTHLFLIDDLPPVARAPGAGAMKVALPAAVWGTFRAAEVDRFTIQANAKQRISFEVVGSRLGKDVDPLITIRDAKGKWVAERDNDPGLCFDCRFEHVFAAAGIYTVEVRDARFHGDEHGTYVLRMGRFPAGRVALPAVVRPGRRTEVTLPEASDAPIALDVPAEQPLGPFVASLRCDGDEGSTWVPLIAATDDVTIASKTADTRERATPAKLPGSLCGVLSKPGASEYFRLNLERGQRIKVRGEARSLGSPADLELVLTDAKGTEVRRASSPGQDDVTFDFSAPAAGDYTLMVRDQNRDGGPAFAYRLDVRGPQPQFSIDAEVEGLTVPRASYQIVPLTITRSERIGPIKLRLIGAPAGVTLTPNEIPETETALVCKLSAAADTPMGLYTMQIVAEPPAIEKGASPTLVHTVPLVDRKRVNIDLIPYALREDQRRVPVALTDRFALQVTAASPFTFELPESQVTLARYQHADFPLATTRIVGFDAPITFTARGGQLGEKESARTRVFATFVPATPRELQVTGSIHSRILANLGKTRIEVEATALYQGRRITLTRSFELQLRTAFIITAEADKAPVNPGATVKVRVLADRIKTFDGPVTVQLTPVQGLDLPATLSIPRGVASVDLDIKIPADLAPRRIGIRARSTGVVGEFEEEQQGELVNIDVRKPEAPKKK